MKYYDGCQNLTFSNAYLHCHIIYFVLLSRFNVFFYGTHQSSVVKNVDLEPFNEVTKAKYLKVKYKHYQESLKELQETPEIYLNFW